MPKAFFAETVITNKFGPLLFSKVSDQGTFFVIQKHAIFSYQLSSRKFMIPQKDREENATKIFIGENGFFRIPEFFQNDKIHSFCENSHSPCEISHPFWSILTKFPFIICSGFKKNASCEESFCESPVFSQD